MLGGLLSKSDCDALGKQLLNQLRLIPVVELGSRTVGMDVINVSWEMPLQSRQQQGASIRKQNIRHPQITGLDNRHTALHLRVRNYSRRRHGCGCFQTPL